MAMSSTLLAEELVSKDENTTDAHKELLLKGVVTENGTVEQNNDSFTISGFKFADGYPYVYPDEGVVEVEDGEYNVTGLSYLPYSGPHDAGAKCMVVPYKGDSAGEGIIIDADVTQFTDLSENSDFQEITKLVIYDEENKGGNTQACGNVNFVKIAYDKEFKEVFVPNPDETTNMVWYNTLRTRLTLRSLDGNESTCHIKVGDNNWKEFVVSGESTMESPFKYDITYGNSMRGEQDVNISCDTPNIAIYHENDLDNGLLNKKDTSDLRELTQWGTKGLVLAEGSFRGAYKLNLHPSDKLLHIDRFLGQAFWAVNIVNDPHMNEWNVSHVEDMGQLFREVDELNISISNWDVSNVIQMHTMFYKTKFSSSDISDWNVSNVEYFGSMFAYNREFDQDIGCWDV